MSSTYRIASIAAQAFSIPMRSAFTSARRSSTIAENVLITARLDDGTAGYGEASPASYVTGESVATVLADAADASSVEGTDARRVRTWANALAEALPRSPTARSAIEMALLDALCRSLGLGLWHFFGGSTASVITDLSIPICAAELAAEKARDAASYGYRTLKLKVGSADADADRERVLAVAAAAPECRLRLDANQAFSPDEVLTFTRDLIARGLEIELLEQPVPKEDLPALRAVTAASPVPVIADEAVLSASDALRIARNEAAHGINIKVAKAGLLGALEIIAIARAAGMRLMLGCMLESLLGIGAALHLACGTGAFDYLDLDSHVLIGLEPRGKPFAQERDRLMIAEDEAGIGWQPGDLEGGER